MPIDGGGDTRLFFSLVRIVEYVDHFRGLLQILEDLGRCDAKIAIDDPILQAIVGGLTILRRNVSGRQVFFAFEDQVLSCDRHDIRDFAGLHCETNLFDRGVTNVFPNRRNESASGRAVGVFGILLCQDAKIFRVGFYLSHDLLRLLGAGGGDHANLHLRAVFRFEFSLQFFVGDLQLVGGQSLQSECRPNDVAAVLLGGNITFLLQHLQPAIFGQIEPPGNPRDFRFNVLMRDPHILLTTGFQNQLLVHQTFQHRFAVPLQALLGELLPRDGLTIDDGDNCGLGDSGGARCGRTGRRGRGRTFGGRPR